MGETGDRQFGRLLRAHRVAAGLSQEELAERARLSRRTVTNLERGVTTAPYRETVALLADALGLTERDRAELETAVDRARTLSVANEGGVRAPGSPVTPAADALVATKLAIPPARAALIPRPRLLERLQTGLRGPLTLISAPAGSGKTTLLSAWRATPGGRKTRLASVSLDAGDNDPDRFWRYIVAALERALPGVDGALGTVPISFHAQHMEPVLTTLINALATHGEDIVLVLDDYHLVEAESIHRMLTYLLEHLPLCLHILLATRADPPLPLARMRARREVVELRAVDLRFTGEETAAFLSTVMGLALSPEDVAALEARTEGWVAGLQLAGLSLQGRPAEDVSAFIAEFAGSHRYIVDYLLDEVLLRQPEPVQRFLLHTCILDRLCAPLCAAILGGEDASIECIAACQEIIESLERNNVFLIALDNERRWYRYHYLFADALCQRQSSHASSPGATELHRRASAWFVKKGQIAEAIRHALAGGSYDAAADLIPRATRPAIFRGATFGLSAWYRALPEDVLRTRPELAIGYAWVLIDFRDLEHAEERLRHAEVALETRADLFAADYCQELQTLIEITRAVIEVMHGNVDRAISRAAEAMDSPAAFDAGTQGSAYFDVIEVRSAGNFALGLAHLSHRAIKEAADYFGRVAADNRDTADRSVFLVLGTAGLASAQRLAGQLDLARAAYERAIEWSTGYAEVPVRAGSHYTGLADVLRERNELDAALEHAMYGLGLEPSLRTPGAERWVEWNVCNVLVLARVKQARGDLNGALADVHEAREQIKRFGTIAFTAILDAFEAQLQLAQGNIDAAVRWLRTAEAQPTPLRVGLTPHVVLYVSEHPEIAPAQVLVAQGRACCASAPLQRALTVLDDLQNKAKRSGMVWLRAKALVLEALARQALGERAAACSALDAALALAEPVGAMRLFLDEGPALADLLRDRRTHGSNPAYAADILSALDVRTLSHQGSTEARNRPAAEPLTERELEVLRLLATGQSAPQIARALYVEVNTVRTHVKHLYGKLGVHSRDQAVWRARELGLLPRDHPAISPSW